MVLHCSYFLVLALILPRAFHFPISRRGVIQKFMKGEVYKRYVVQRTYTYSVTHAALLPQLSFECVCSLWHTFHLLSRILEIPDPFLSLLSAIRRMPAKGGRQQAHKEALLGSSTTLLLLQPVEERCQEFQLRNHIHLPSQKAHLVRSELPWYRYVEDCQTYAWIIPPQTGNQLGRGDAHLWS